MTKKIQKTVKKIIRHIKSAGRIFIAGHVNPDGDAIGACFALAEMISSTFGKMPVVLLGKYQTKYDILGCEFVHKNDNPPDVQPDALFIALDVSDQGRLGEFREVFEKCSFTTNIDHHATNDGFANLTLVDEDASSTCELLYHLFKKSLCINEKAASALYSGIIYDTGRFAHSCTRAATHKATMALLKKSIDAPGLTRTLLTDRSVSEARIIGRAAENMKMADNDTIIYTTLSRQDMEQTGAEYADLDGVMPFITTVQGRPVAAMFSERPDGIKLSLRAVEADVANFAKRYGGGGHKLAAGATISGGLQEAVETVIPALIEYLKNSDNVNGLINVYKEKGRGSRETSAAIGKTLGERAGHVGTLDPDAEGVLPVCVGKALKLHDWLLVGRKEYACEVILGAETDTEDATGTIIAKAGKSFMEREITSDKISDAVNSFIGGYFQTPPMYSAVRVGGKRLYELARKNMEVERAARRAEIYGIEITESRAPYSFDMCVSCGKGTYIRTLCADIGKKLGCGGHMGGLIRTGCGFLKIENALRLGEMQELYEKSRTDFLIPLEEILTRLGMQRAKINENAAKLLLNGNAISASDVIFEKPPADGENVAAYSGDKLIAVYKYDESSVMIKSAAMLV